MKRGQSIGRSVARLGRNINGYFGEQIDIHATLAELESAAQKTGWHSESFGTVADLKLLALHREPGQPGKADPFRVYISAGIHGDEPAGPLAVLQLVKEGGWPARAEIWLCPCLNPSGFALNRRENERGVDLNRQYLQPQAYETLAHIEWLNQQPRFDLCLCLHEDWESHGFYIYELNPDDRESLAARMLECVGEVCPIDNSEMIEGRPARGGLIRPSVDPRSRPQWPESFYLLTNKTRLSYTLEAPSDFPLTARVEALVAAVRGALNAACNQP